MIPLTRHDAFNASVCILWVACFMLYACYGFWPDPTFLEVQRHARHTQTQLQGLHREIGMLQEAFIMYKTNGPRRD
jgi:hypothetical protein